MYVKRRLSTERDQYREGQVHDGEVVRRARRPSSLPSVALLPLYYPHPHYGLLISI